MTRNREFPSLTVFSAFTPATFVSLLANRLTDPRKMAQHHPARPGNPLGEGTGPLGVGATVAALELNVASAR